MSPFFSYVLLFAPLCGFALLAFVGRRHGSVFWGLLATGFMLISAAAAVGVCLQYATHGQQGDVYGSLVVWKHHWLPLTPTLQIEMGMLLDPLSCMMVLLVTLISLLVHIYSISYMQGEERYVSYFAFLQLFTFSMLGLVVAVNLFQVYFFWELVGVSSYLLIGFHYDRTSAAAAAKKAFVVTRFADLGFLIGILLLSYYGGSLDIGTLLSAVEKENGGFAGLITTSFLGISVLTWGSVLTFMGAAGKSAMFPLHIWLPDAMEGPTPVSALIHAATMVVAGVYLVARLFPFYEVSGVALEVVSAVGLLSALMAALVALTQSDVKRVLAYSTMSQIGLMMCALGLGPVENGLGFTASLFHLFTHGFFKALLFLAAGIVIHHVHSNEVTAMGGLRTKLPTAHAVFLIACLSIAGIPPFSGFFSKELIVQAAALDRHVYWIGILLVSGLTAFYMFRLYFLMFWHSIPPISVHHEFAHRRQWSSMGLPLWLLAAASAGVGFLPFAHFVTRRGIPLRVDLSWDHVVMALTVSLAGLLVAALFYMRADRRIVLQRLSRSVVYRFISQKFYVDELYRFVFHRLIFQHIARPMAWVDRHVVDGAVHAIGYVTAGMAYIIRSLQSGHLQQYALWYFVGLVLLLYVLAQRI